MFCKAKECSPLRRKETKKKEFRHRFSLINAEGKDKRKKERNGFHTKPQWVQRKTENIGEISKDRGKKHWTRIPHIDTINKSYRNNFNIPHFNIINTVIMAVDQIISTGRCNSHVASNKRSNLAANSSSAFHRIIIIGILGKGYSFIEASP